MKTNSYKAGKKRGEGFLTMKGGRGVHSEEISCCVLWKERK